MRIELLEAAADAADRLGIREGQRAILDRLSDLELDPDEDAEAIGRVYLLHGRYAVSTGQQVSQGQLLGYGGRTGYATGNHLHFEVHLSGKVVNPIEYLP